MKIIDIIANQCINCTIPVKNIDIIILYRTLSKTSQYGQMSLNYFYRLLEVRPYLCVTYHFRTNKYTYALHIDDFGSTITIPYVSNVNLHQYLYYTYLNCVKSFRTNKFLYKRK